MRIERRLVLFLVKRQVQLSTSIDTVLMRAIQNRLDLLADSASLPAIKCRRTL
jgi:hypothetical protein